MITMNTENTMLNDKIIRYMQGYLDIQSSDVHVVVPWDRQAVNNESKSYRRYSIFMNKENEFGMFRF